MSRDELPVVPGEVIGWRVWIVTSRPRLRSPIYEIDWPTDSWLVAGDGGPRCGTLGIHAARSRDVLLEMGYPGWEYSSGIVAIGEVGLAGLIHPGEDGYRAEKARVMSVLLPYIAWELVEPLRRAYRVPVGLSNVLVNIKGGQVGHRS